MIIGCSMDCTVKFLFMMGTVGASENDRVCRCKRYRDLETLFCETDVWAIFWSSFAS
jgi:hypothetical protein